jgi:hypothetical protein
MRWKASGVVTAREGMWVVMKSVRRPSVHVRPESLRPRGKGTRRAGSKSLNPPCETHPLNSNNSIKNQPFRTSNILS